MRAPGRAAGMVIVGAAGRNLGKTELACALIRRWADAHDVIGVKVTTVRERGGPCPRGGEGCGVCAALEERFCLSEETPAADPDALRKDTQRMLAAGAQRVLWLRVLADHLEEGAAALRERLGEDAICVCESNSLRHVVTPDLFVIVSDPAAKRWKPSAEAVRALADHIVVSDGARFTPTPDQFGLEDGRWSLRRPATAIVLAGGQSRRMGRDKALLELGGQPLIARVVRQVARHFDEVLVSANDPARYAFLELPVLPDETPDQGPLMGLATAMAAARHDTCFVIACDVPEVRSGLVTRLLREARGAPGAVPVGPNGHMEPLFAVYDRRHVLPAARALLAAGVRKVTRLYDTCDVRFVPLSDEEQLTNLNTPAAYEALRRSAR